MKAHFFSSSTAWSMAFALFLMASGSAAAHKKLVFGQDAQDDTRKIVRATDPSAATIDIQTMVDQVTHHYKIDLGTVIKFNNASASPSVIKVGMEVSDYVERDPQTLDSLSLIPAGTTAPPAPAAKTRKSPSGDANQ